MYADTNLFCLHDNEHNTKSVTDGSLMYVEIAGWIHTSTTVVDCEKKSFCDTRFLPQLVLVNLIHGIQKVTNDSIWESVSRFYIFLLLSD